MDRHINNEQQTFCAVIGTLAMENHPIDFKTDFMLMKGRSHYWGNNMVIAF